MADFEIKSNVDGVVKDLEEAVLRALTRIGQQAQGYATDLAPVAESYGGTLSQSIGYVVDQEAEVVYVGTQHEYGIYVELGTGLYIDGGRKTPWTYQDEKTGEWRRTHGQKAQPYLKPAITDHIDTYKNIIKDELGG